MPKITVIYHSADYDGIFCREIAKHFLGPDRPASVSCEGVQYIGWNFGDPSIPIPDDEQTIYIMDLPVDKVFGLVPGPLPLAVRYLEDNKTERLIWIDHHKTSIDSHPKDIPGYRIDGVAACRLAWQWFNRVPYPAIDKQWCELPCKEYFIDRKVKEPLAVRLTGEYDVWDKRDTRADLFQYSLRSVDLTDQLWERMLRNEAASENAVNEILPIGEASQRYSKKQDANMVEHNSWLMDWEGLKWLCLNCGPFNSLTFASRDIPATGHDALLGFRWTEKHWLVSLYHAKHRTDLDLSAIAAKYGGGGHRGASGFTCKVLPFQLS